MKTHLIVIALGALLCLGDSCSQSADAPAQNRASGGSRAGTGGTGAGGVGGTGPGGTGGMDGSGIADGHAGTGGFASGGTGGKGYDGAVSDGSGSGDDASGGTGGNGYDGAVSDGSGGITSGGADGRGETVTGGTAGMSTGGTTSEGGTTITGLGGVGGCHCVEAGAGGTGTAGAGGVAGHSGTGGVVQTGGSSATGGTSGAGGSSAAGCPQVAPTNGAGCDNSKDGPCYYEDCTESGRTIALCPSGSWQVSTGACTSVTCNGYSGGDSVTCPAGQVCLAEFGRDPTCVTHTCGKGPVTWQCVPGANPGTSGWCDLRDSVGTGLTVSCCPYGGTSC